MRRNTRVTEAQRVKPAGLSSENEHSHPVREAILAAAVTKVVDLCCEWVGTYLWPLLWSRLLKPSSVILLKLLIIWWVRWWPHWWMPTWHR